MARKVVLVADPGIDAAFAIALALADPALDVVGVVPCAGNVSAQQATANVHCLLDRLDPPKRPRSAQALPITYDRDRTALHGTDGLGQTHFPHVERHSSPPADKVIPELVREFPREVSVLNLGPATTLAHVLDRDPELIPLLDRVVIVGGTWREPGDAGPVGEFHLTLDPIAARRLLHLGLHPWVVPLDVGRKLVLSPTELAEVARHPSAACQLLRQFTPFALRASAEHFGIEGVCLAAVAGVVAVALPGAVTFEERFVDVETQGELTRGMLVVEDRPLASVTPNVLLGVGLSAGEARQYVSRGLTRPG